MSKQIIAFKKPLSKSSPSARRRSLRQREQSARRQRWHDANQMINFVLANILNHPHDRQVKSEFESLIERNAKRLKAKQTDEQIVLKAIRNGHRTIKAIETETGLTSELVIESLKELQRLDKVMQTIEGFQLTPTD